MDLRLLQASRSWRVYPIQYSQMEEKPLTNAELQKATSRRSRKDEQGRDFQCGCGKRYLSYPALYTHIKTKHDGRQPEGTLKTGLAAPHPKRTRGKLEDEALRQLHSLADREDYPLLSQLEDGHLGSIALGSRIKKEQLPKEICDCYAAMLKQQECKLTATASLDLALAVYLLNAGEFVGERVYEYYLLFARAARGCFHEHGEEIYKVYHAGKQHFPAFAGELADFPTIAEFLVCHYLPESEGREREAAIPMVQLILQDFCNWLLRRKLTRLRLTLVRDYRLQVKPALPRHKPTPRKDDASKENNSQELKKEPFEESEESEQEEEEEHEPHPLEP